MLLQEYVIESIRPYSQLYELTDDDYKNSKEKQNILQKIAQDFNYQFQVKKADGSLSRPDLHADDIKAVWMKLWRDFKDYTRRRQICKSGDGAKKGLDPKHIQLMEKMNGFEVNVPDLFSNTISTLQCRFNKGESKSIWQSAREETSNPCKKRKVPPVSGKYTEREDRKNQLVKMIVDVKQTIDELTKQSKDLVSSKSQASQPLAPEDKAKSDVRTSLLNIVDQYLINLDADDRASCFQEMLNVFE